MARKSKIIKVGRIVDNLKDTYKLDDKKREYEALRLWPELVGRRIAAGATPLYISEKVLYVQAAGSVWCQEIAFRKNEIIKSLNEKLGFEYITDIRYKVDAKS